MRRPVWVCPPLASGHRWLWDYSCSQTWMPECLSGQVCPSNSGRVRVQSLQPPRFEGLTPTRVQFRGAHPHPPLPSFKSSHQRHLLDPGGFGFQTLPPAPKKTKPQTTHPSEKTKASPWGRSGVSGAAGKGSPQPAPAPGSPAPASPIAVAEGGKVGRAAPAPLRQSARRQPPVPGPSRLCSRTALPSALVRSLFFFFFSLSFPPPLPSSAIFPLQSIAGNRMWVTQQHCFKLRKLPLLLPKGSGGARGYRCGCRSRGGAGAARGGGSGGRSPSHVPEDRESGSGPLRLRQLLEVSGERGGGNPGPGSAGTETKRARQTSPQSLGSSRGARSGSWQRSLGWGGGRGDALDPGRLGRDRGGGGNPCFPGGVPGRCLGSPLPFLGVRSPVPSSCRPGGRVRCARRVPSALFSPPQPEREGSERTEGFVVHPGSEPDAATGPGCPPRPLDSLAWSMPEPPPTPPSPVPWTRGGCSSLPICIYISLSVCVCVSPQPLTFPFSVCSWEGWRGGGKSVGSTLCCRGAEGRPRFPASCSRLRKAEKHRKAGLG